MEVSKRDVCAFALAFGLPLTGAFTQPLPPKRAVPVDPVSGIVEAFRFHRVVALAEGTHNNEPAHAFRLTLIRDSRFQATVNDIVVEFGSARYQSTIDQFVGGDAVADVLLRQVWQNTTQPQAIWDVPIYEEFFRAVRAVNASLPAERRLRVLLGDPPIDWDLVRSKDDLMAQMKTLDRDRYPAELVRREVLAKGRRALLIYGDGHLARRDVLQNFEPSPFLLPQLEADGEPRVFSIWTETGIDLSQLQSDVGTWRKPSLVMLQGTVLGTADAARYLPEETPRFASAGNGPDFSKPLPRAQWRTLPMQDQFDAVLYLGAPSEITMSRLPPRLCEDRSYMDMRMQRMTWAGMQRLIDRLKQYCATVVRP